MAEAQTPWPGRHASPPRPPSTLQRRQRISPLARHKERWFYLLISPWIIGFILFQGGPVVGAAFLSLTHWRLTQAPEWVGLANFQTLLQDPLFAKTAANTLYYTVGSVPLGLVVAFLLATLLNQQVRGVYVFRTIFFLPSVVAGVAVVLLWGWIFNGQYGILNALLARVGVDGPAWLQDTRYAMPALILMSLWNVGWSMLIYLAALQGVPRELYEASAMDGAGRWARLRHITLPLVSPVTFFLLITGVIGSFQVFTPTYILTRGGPDNATLTVALFIYFNAFAWNKIGYAAAVAWALFVAVLLLTFTQFKLAGRWVYYEQEAA